jgi:hypothetical protein
VGEPHDLLRELRQLFQEDPAIFELFGSVALDGIWYWDLEEPDREWLSPRFRSLLGYGENEIPNTPAWRRQNIHADDLERALANLEAHKKDPDHPYDQVVRYAHEDGSTVWVRCRGFAIRDEAGEPIRMLGTYTDVTALERAKRELSGADRELEEYARIVSHDIRAPLRAIESFGELLATECAGALSGDAAQYLHYVIDGARRIKSMVEGMLEIARVEGGKDPRVDVDLGAVLDEVERSLATEIAGAGAEIRRGELPVVRARRVQMVCLLENLVGNAVKFSTGSPVIDVAGRAEGGEWIIEVSDDGIGLEPRHVERIFQLFQRLHTADEYPGEGIGLALCKKIAESHGGSISVQSSAGQGARFVVALPR